MDSTSSNSSPTQTGEYSKRLSNQKGSGFHESFRLDEDFFRNLVESLDDYAVLTTDMDGVVSSWSHGAQKLFGYSEQEIVGKNCEIIFTSADVKHNVPIIMFSANTDMSKSVKIAGADEFIAKPFQMDELLELVGQYAHK